MVGSHHRSWTWQTRRCLHQWRVPQLQTLPGSRSSWRNHSQTHLFWRNSGPSNDNCFLMWKSHRCFFLGGEKQIQSKSLRQRTLICGVSCKVVRWVTTSVSENFQPRNLIALKLERLYTMWKKTCWTPGFPENSSETPHHISEALQYFILSTLRRKHVYL